MYRLTTSFKPQNVTTSTPKPDAKKIMPVAAGGVENKFFFPDITNPFDHADPWKQQSKPVLKLNGQIMDDQLGMPGLVNNCMLGAMDDQGIRQLKGSTSTEHNESPFEAMQGLDSLLESTSYPDSRQYFNNTTLSEQQTICGSPTLLQTNCFTFDLKESKKPNDSGLSMNTNDANISFQHLTPGFRPASIWLQNLDHSQELKGANLNFDNNSTISNISILSDNREMFYENQPKFYPKAKFPVKFECGDGVTFAPKSVFEPYSAFGQNCSFGGGCTFGEFCSFGSNARFGALSKFGSDCMFGQMCVFAKKCVFGTNCSWGGYCRLEDGCCAVAGVFESSCRFVGSVELSNCRFASCFDTDYDICR